MRASRGTLRQVVVRNLILGAIVFVPVLMLSTMLVEIPAGGEPFEGGWLYQIGAVLVFYPGLCLMISCGVLAHSLILWILMRRQGGGSGAALTAFVLAPLVPLVPTLLELSGWMTLASLVPTTLATIAYGIGAARVARAHQAASNSAP